MFTRFTLALTILVFLLPPSQAPSESWYKKDWAIATGGALAGGAIGYTLGKHNQSAPSQYSSDGTPHYYREKRAFPFYKKIESYPILVSPVNPNGMQAISAVNDPSYESESETNGESPYTISIYIGDNNNNVSVSVSDELLKKNNSETTQYLTMANNDNTTPGRKVDVPLANETLSPEQPIQQQEKSTED